MLLTVLHGLLQLLVALIPLAIWQRTRIAGFLWIAAAYALETLSAWSGQLLLANIDPGLAPQAIVVWRLAGFAILAVGAFGFWQVYVTMKQRWPATDA